MRVKSASSPSRAPARPSRSYVALVKGRFAPIPSAIPTSLRMRPIVKPAANERGRMSRGNFTSEFWLRPRWPLK